MKKEEEVFYGTNEKFIKASELYHPIDENLNYSKELLTDIKFRRSYFIEGCEYQLKEQNKNTEKQINLKYNEILEMLIRLSHCRILTEMSNEHPIKKEFKQLIKEVTEFKNK